MVASVVPLAYLEPTRGTIRGPHHKQPVSPSLTFHKLRHLKLSQPMLLASLVSADSKPMLSDGLIVC